MSSITPSPTKVLGFLHLWSVNKPLDPGLPASSSWMPLLKENPSELVVTVQISANWPVFVVYLAK